MVIISLEGEVLLSTGHTLGLSNLGRVGLLLGGGDKLGKDLGSDWGQVDDLALEVVGVPVGFVVQLLGLAIGQADSAGQACCALA